MELNRNCPNCSARSAIYIGNYAPNTFIPGIWVCGACKSSFELSEEEIAMAKDAYGNPVPDNHGVMPGQPVFEEPVDENAAFSEEVVAPDTSVGPVINVTAEEVNVTEKSDDTDNDEPITVGSKNPVKDTEDDNVATRRGRPRSK